MPKTECELDRDGGSIHCQCEDGSSNTGPCENTGDGIYCENPCNK
jgi:hypothetical protein